jgi:hypothetical protein
MRRVLIESPYAGNVALNLRYARACMRDALERGEAPYASHLLYTQPGILDDTIPAQRAHGIEAGLIWGACAELTAVYTDLGVSGGMNHGITRAIKEGRRVEHRKLGGAWEGLDNSETMPLHTLADGWTERRHQLVRDEVARLKPELLNMTGLRRILFECGLRVVGAWRTLLGKPSPFELMLLRQYHRHLLRCGVDA